MTIVRSNFVGPPSPNARETIPKAPKIDNDHKQIKQLAEEFESFFIGIVLKSMRDTVPKDGMINGGNAEDIYRSMLDAEYAKEMSRQRTTGIADNIEKFLLQSYDSQVKSQEFLTKDIKSAAISAYEQASRLK